MNSIFIRQILLWQRGAMNLEMVFDFPEGLPRRPKPGDILKEGIFKYEITSSVFWDGKCMIFTRPIGIAKVWYSILMIFNLKGKN